MQDTKQKKYEEKSWHFDPATKRKVARESTEPYQLLDATKKDKQKVVDFYQHHPVPGKEIGRVQVIYNRTFNKKFNLQLETLQYRYENPGFLPTWENENQPQWREETNKKLEEMAKPHTDSTYPEVKILPLWHGTKSEILSSIFKTGYANLATTDSGFFGKGIYGAYEAEYPHRVYSQGALILNWVATFSAYPVIHGDMDKLKEKGNYQNYDAHFVPVVPRNPNNPNEVSYFPCLPNQKNQYTEVVVFESASCLPRYLVELQSTSITKNPIVVQTPAKTVTPAVVSPTPAKTVTSAVVSPTPAKTVTPAVVTPTPAKTITPAVVSPTPAKTITPAVVSPTPAKTITPAVVSPTPAKTVTPAVVTPTPAKTITPAVVSPTPAKTVTPAVVTPTPAKTITPAVVSPTPAKTITPAVVSPTPAKIVTPAVVSPTPAKIVTPAVVSPTPAKTAVWENKSTMFQPAPPKNPAVVLVDVKTPAAAGNINLNMS